MKNQYFGDVGDYGKYGLLRFLANNNIKIAVNWYLTPDDGSNDGKHITYLQNQAMKKYDPELFEVLGDMVSDGKRDVLEFEKRKMIPDAIYYNRLLCVEGNTREEKREYRNQWHKEALECCAGAELVFLDPDNGACEKEPKNVKDTIKYCYANEIADYYNAGQDVVYYCSKGRRNYEQWEYTKELVKRRLPEAKTVIITFHKGTQRSYIFVLHKESFRKYAELIKKFLWRWSRIFTEEFGRTGNIQGDKTGEKFCVTDSAGVEMIMEECEDGWVEIRFSNQKNTSYRLSIDNLFRRLK